MPFNKTPLALAAVLLALTLSACGDSNDNNDNGDDTGDTPSEPSDPTFSSEAVTWSPTVPGEGDALCFDFDAGAEVPCDDSAAWDLKFDGNMQLWTNGGTSGSGQGAAFGLLSWTDLLGWETATVDPASGTDVSEHYFEDSAAGVFTDADWYAYNLQGTHQLYPNYRVYLITTAPGQETAREYAMQVIGYYGGDGGTASGHPSLRWIDRSAPDAPMTLQVDASSSETWVYLSLASGEVLPIDDATAETSLDWDIALRRYEIKLNGGSSGPGTVAGYLGKTPAGFYDENGEPVVETFVATTPDDTVDELTAEDIAEPSSPYAWILDSTQSVLNPDYTGSYPEPLDYGWYVYDPATHFISVDTDAGALLRSGGGASYSRFHLTALDYADTNDPSSAITWHFEFNVQPAAE